MLREYFSCGILVVDSQSSAVTMSREGAELLGLRPNAPVHVDALPEPVVRIIAEASASGTLAPGREIILSHPSGESVRLMVSAFPHSPGRAGGVTVVLRDFSAVERLERDLRRLDHLANVGTLSASMAHEIRNAHVAMRTFVDLLLEKHPGAELADLVRQEMSRVEALAGQMLKFARPSLPASASVHLHEVLEQALRMVRHRIEGRLISFEKQFRAPSDSLRGDARQLEQAFVNLFLNSIEAMGTSGTLKVATEVFPLAPVGDSQEGAASGRSLQVSITDDGPGIRPENMSRIFEPFFTTKESGTGLGLPVAVRIFQEHGGSIQVESHAGKRTTFTVLLPMPA